MEAQEKVQTLTSQLSTNVSKHTLSVFFPSMCFFYVFSFPFVKYFLRLLDFYSNSESFYFSFFRLSFLSFPYDFMIPISWFIL